MENQKITAKQFIEKRLGVAFNHLSLGVAQGAILLSKTLELITEEEYKAYMEKVMDINGEFEKEYLEKEYLAKGKTYEDYLNDKLK